jgi:hypothetical protein
MRCAALIVAVVAPACDRETIVADPPAAALAILASCGSAEAVPKGERGFGVHVELDRPELHRVDCPGGLDLDLTATLATGTAILRVPGVADQVAAAADPRWQLDLRPFVERATHDVLMGYQVAPIALQIEERPRDGAPVTHAITLTIDDVDDAVRARLREVADGKPLAVPPTAGAHGPVTALLFPPIEDYYDAHAVTAIVTEPYASAVSDIARVAIVGEAALQPVASCTYRGTDDVGHPRIVEVDRAAVVAEVAVFDARTGAPVAKQRFAPALDCPPVAGLEPPWIHELRADPVTIARWASTARLAQSR